MQKTHTTGVGLTTDLDTINGRFGSYMQERRWADSTRIRYQRVLRNIALWLDWRRRRLADVTLEDVPHIVRYFSLGRGDICKEERRAVLHAWLRFGGRFKRVSIPTPWQRWIDDHLHFLEAHKGHAADTICWRRTTVTSYLRWQFGSREADWSRVGPPDIIRYSHDLAQRGLSRLTVKGMLSGLRQFLRFVELRGACAHSLVEAVPSISAYGQSPARPEVLSDQQRRRLLAAFARNQPNGRRNYAMTICMVDLGLRMAEVIALRLDSIDWERRQLTVPPVKNGRGRTLPLPQRVYAALRAYVDRGRPASQCAQLFLADVIRCGTPLSVQAARQHILRAFKRCEFPASWGGVHRLRHTFASRLHAHGADLKQIADLLGHRDLETTNLYAQIDVSDLRALVQPWPLAS
jgi:site-specific recombinase XerD